MKLVCNVENYRENNNGLAIALGNFDGLHLAHRKIIEKTIYKAEEMNLKSAVFLLDPHPVKVLYPHKDFFLLSSLQERAEILAEMGIDFIIIQKFTADMAMLSPFKFIEKYLIKALNVKEIVIGFDYTFGRQGKGTTFTLLKWKKIFNYQVEIVSPVMIGNDVVSSSLIRDLILNGEVLQASKYLGRYFTRKGKVIHGEARGRNLGFPTANLEIGEEYLLPGNGVYLSLVLWKDRKMFGLTNIGNKPTFSSGNKISFEIFLLDFNEFIYTEELTVMFLHRIRDEMTFKDGSYLIKQIESDLKSARKLINNEYRFLMEKQCT